ncbi:MAG TPA: hypothetical protein VLX28_14915, partial [Thermoanaerobaculia bacterium]|nr:hypothetical protein [Thermoanaerobaculia bacterium]
LRYQMLTQPDSSLAGSSRVLASISSAAEDEEIERRVATALRKLLTPPPPPSTPSQEDLEKLMERTLLKFIGGIKAAQG